MGGDKGQQEIRERVWVEKFDHTGETPVLVETQFVERTRRETVIPTPPAPMSEST